MTAIPGKEMNNMTNSVEMEDPRPIYQKTFEAAYMIVIILLATSGNLLVLVAIRMHRSLQTKTSVFTVNLAIADCLVGFILTPFLAGSNIKYGWIAGPVYCNINGLTNSLFCLTSMQTLAAIALDRYCAIIHPLRYIEIMTSRVVTVLVVWTWMSSLLFALLPIFTGFSRYKYFQNEYLCTADWGYNYSYSLTVFGFCFFLPLMLMIYCYYHILKVARWHSRRIRDEGSVSGDGDQVRATQRRRDAKAATMLLVVIGTFLCCWLPHFLGILCLTFTLDNCPWSDISFTATTWLAMTNSACNPVIYGIMDKRLRKGMKNVLFCFRVKTQHGDRIGVSLATTDH